ncbi:hypothetical protein QUF74_14385 [Candidatus Halobeggiatoa sp. HSG11]|nr:hypothetical protein [Candidatus Halobeggiatoa sp. HSG11]
MNEQLLISFAIFSSLSALFLIVALLKILRYLFINRNNRYTSQHNSLVKLTTESRYPCKSDLLPQEATDAIKELKFLRDSGIMSQNEYDDQKFKVMKKFKQSHKNHNYNM